MLRSAKDPRKNNHQKSISPSIGNKIKILNCFKNSVKRKMLASWRNNRDLLRTASNPAIARTVFSFTSSTCWSSVLQLTEKLPSRICDYTWPTYPRRLLDFARRIIPKVDILSYHPGTFNFLRYYIYKGFSSLRY